MRTDIVRRVVLSIALGVAMAASAAPFDMWFEARLTDGRTIRIHGVGDEYAARFEDEEGRNLVYNPQAGAYEYAEREDDETFRRRAIERRLKDEEESGLARRWAAMKARRHKKTSSKPMLMAPPEDETHGRIVGVTLLVDFPALDDHGNATTLSQLVHPDVTATDLDNLINGTNFRKYGNASSVREYFADASSGHVDYTNIVIGWIQVPYPREHYDVPTDSDGDCGRRLIGDVLDIIKNNTEYTTLIRQATTDAEGDFLALNIYFAGEAATTWSYGLWAHKWSLSDDLYYNFSISIGGRSCHFFQYQISPVTSSPSIGTFCHENGHLICGFPDLYAYTKEGGIGGGAGYSCLMSHNSDDKIPPNFCAYLRAAAGWVTPKDLPSSSGLVTVSNDLQDVWRFSHPTDPKQYYLIENRQNIGRDAKTKMCGIVIYRCDEAGSNTHGARTTRRVFVDYGNATNRIEYEVSVEQADGLYQVESDDMRWDYTDTWFGNNKAPLYAGRFNSDTIPCARWTDGSAASIDIMRFSRPQHDMTFWNYVPVTGHHVVANDDWENAILLTENIKTTSYDVKGSVNGVNNNATVQPGEPLLSAYADHTVWWKWVAPQDARVTFDTSGSAIDTVLGVYTSAEPGTFSEIAKNDDVSYDDHTSSVTFMATAGEMYYICVGEYDSSGSGEIQLNWMYRPVNDDVENAIPISVDDSGFVTGVNSNASVVTSEPLQQHFAACHTLWWTWTVPRDCSLRLNTVGSVDDFGNTLDTMLGVYTLSGGTFSTIAENNGMDGNADVSVKFIARKDVTYYICVGTSGAGVLGSVRLNWFAGPVNDDWENAFSISGRSGRASGITINATVQEGEPLPRFNPSATDTVWWKWTAPENCRVTFDTIGSEVASNGEDMYTILGAYTRSGGQFLTKGQSGSTWNNNNLDFSRVTFTAEEGVTYYICVSSYHGATGYVELNWESRPANDYWDIAPEISGMSGAVSCGNANVTAQAEDPIADYLEQQGGTAARTAWWKWTAPVDGEVVFDTIGSCDSEGEYAMDTALGIYTYSGVLASPVAETASRKPSEQQARRRRRCPQPRQVHCDCGDDILHLRGHGDLRRRSHFCAYRRNPSELEHGQGDLRRLQLCHGHCIAIRQHALVGVDGAIRRQGDIRHDGFSAVRRRDDGHRPLHLHEFRGDRKLGGGIPEGGRKRQHQPPHDEQRHVHGRGGQEVLHPRRESRQFRNGQGLAELGSAEPQRRVR